ncbi:hypothetical protein KXX35_009459 [Aspergillus fumigatus]|nr:hypothetical protein KXX35_009459 [Aspergillus fumigatus]
MAPPPLPIIADDDSTRDDGLLAQVALAQLLVEFQQAQTARPLGVKDRRVKQVELSLGYRMLQYRWNTSRSPACSRGLRSSLTEDGEFHQAPLWGLLVSGGIGTWQAMLDLNEIMSSPLLQLTNWSLAWTPGIQAGVPSSVTPTKSYSQMRGVKAKKRQLRPSAQQHQHSSIRQPKCRLH